MKMKVLQVNNVYDRLSTGKIVADLHREYLLRGIDSYVCFGRGPLVDDNRVTKVSTELYSKLNKIRAWITGDLYGGCYFSTRKLIREIRRVSPNVVHLHCINDNFLNIYRLMNYLQRNDIKTVYTLHATFPYTGSCGYHYDCMKWKTGCGNCPQLNSLHVSHDHTRVNWSKMRNAYSTFGSSKLYFTSVSPWLMNLAKQSPFMSKFQNFVVMNGVDTDSFRRANVVNTERKRYISDNKPAVLFVTSSFLSPSKGGRYLVELAKRMKDVNFVVLGLKENIPEIPSNIILLGRIYDRYEIAKIYSIVNATIILSRAETFSMPTAESLCCGVPVVGFRAGGPESIALPDYSKFVEYGNLDELERALRETITNITPSETISQKAITKYSRHAMAEEYINIYNKILNSDE